METSLAAALRERGQRVTPQRLMVARVLNDLDRHVTAEVVFDEVSRRMPGVSLPTVYATLDLLEEHRPGASRRLRARRGRLRPAHRRPPSPGVPALRQRSSTSTGRWTRGRCSPPRSQRVRGRPRASRGPRPLCHLRGLTRRAGRPTAQTARRGLQPGVKVAFEPLERAGAGAHGREGVAFLLLHR